MWIPVFQLDGGSIGVVSERTEVSCLDPATRVLPLDNRDVTRIEDCRERFECERVQLVPVTKDTMDGLAYSVALIYA